MSARLKGRRLIAEKAISACTSWADGQASVIGLILVGSYAYGRPKMASDVDLLVLTSMPGSYTGGVEWIDGLYAGARLIRTTTWGPVTERRLRLRSGLQIEIGITTATWAAVPLDAGTARVLSDGYRILYDLEGQLHTAVAALTVRRRIKVQLSENEPKRPTWT